MIVGIVVECRLSVLWSALLLCIGLLAFACSSGRTDRAVRQSSASAAVASVGETSLRTLSGTVRDPNGIGLQGVGVTVGRRSEVTDPRREGRPGPYSRRIGNDPFDLGVIDGDLGDPPAAVTDANGNFIVLDPAPGEVEVTFDGTTAIAAGTFPVVQTTIEIHPTGPTNLPHAITLPDLTDPASASGSVPTSASGATTIPINISNGNPAAPIVLSGPAGTVITINGQPAAGSVLLTVTPVAPNKVPVAPPPGLDPSSVVVIDPIEAAFAPPGAQGLDLDMPNLRGVPANTLMEIWAIDPDTNTWVNRTAETGESGKVSLTGMRVVAKEVVRKGGYHATMLAVNALWATTVTGRVVDQGSNPIPGALVSTNFGQFGTTIADGTFSIPCVPAYDASQMTFVALDVILDVLTPVSYGAVSASKTVLAAQIMPMATTNAGDITATVPATGDLSGQVLDTGLPVPGGTVTITGPTSTTATTDINGKFSVLGLQPGSYTASFQFSGEPSPRDYTFAIVANQVTTVTLQRIMGSGTEDITVLVLRDHDGLVATPMLKASGARVMLYDCFSFPAGLSGITNADGEVLFDGVASCVDVTAQLDFTVPGTTLLYRAAATVSGISPATGVVGVPILSSMTVPAPADATLSGTVSNLPTLGAGEELVVVAEQRDESTRYLGSVDSGTGAYSVNVPSGVVLDAVLIHRDTDEVAFHGMVAFDLGPIGSGGSLVRDFDFGSSAKFAFDQTVAVTYGNVPAATLDGQDIELFLRNGTGGRVRFSLFADGTGMASLPSSIQMPDLGGTALTGLQAELEASLGTANDYTACQYFPASTPSSTHFALTGFGSVSYPPAGATLSAAQFASERTINYIEGSGGGGSGFVLIDVSSQNTRLPVDLTDWVVFSPLGQFAVALDPGVLPMWSSATDYEVVVETIHSSLSPFSLSSFFNENVEQNFANLVTNDFCVGETASTFKTK